jgi:predicted permease
MPGLNWVIERIFRRKRRFEDLSVSIQEHLCERIDELVDEGMTRWQAEQKARREFGNVTLIHERSRAVWQWPRVETVWADLRYAARQLRKSPGFAITAILTLTLAVGANTAVFSLMNALLLRSLPVRDPRQLVLLSYGFGGWPTGGFNSSGYGGYEFSYPLFERFRQQDQSFSDVFGYASLGFKEKNLVLRMHGETMQATGTMVTGGYFGGLGVIPALGREIDEDDLSQAAPRVAVISYGFWQRAFAGSSSAIGQNVTLNSTPYTIVGVAPRGFAGVQPGIMDDLWIPISGTSALAPWGIGGLEESPTTSERWWWLTVIGRLRPGASKQQAESGLSAQLVATMAALKGEKPSGAQLPFVKLEDGSRGMPFLQELYAQPAALLMGMVGLVLLAACANLATLLLARGSARQREIAVRLAVGASRARLWRQLLTESLLLSVTGGALGVLVAPLATRAIAAGLNTRGAEQLSLDMTLDYRVLLFTAGLSLLTGLCFGIAPALRSGRVDVNTTLKDGASTETGRSNLPMRSLVVAQAAISTMLLIVSGIFLQSLAALRGQPTGFDQDHLLIFHLEPSQSGYANEQLAPLYEQIEQRLAALPGVRGATTIGNAFISGWQNNFDVQVEGYTAPDHQDPNVLNNMGGAHFLATAGIPLLKGRDFSESDTSTSPKVAIVNESFAKKYFGTRSPIGYRITFKPWKEDPVSYTIVGMCADARYNSLRNEIRPTWYQAMQQEKTAYLKSVNFMLRANGNPEGLTSSVVAALRGIDSRLLATDIKTQSEQIDVSLRSEQMFAELSTFFGALALLLAALGLYGTLAYSVARREREMGIRLALGAERRSLVRLVLSQGLRLVVVGIVAGWAASALAGRLLAHMMEDVLFHVHAFDPFSFVGAALILTTLACAAAVIPARRAAGTDPMRALRSE